VKWRVIIRPRAEADLRDGRNWYENQRTGLGEEFLVETANTIKLLLHNPELRSEYYRGFRRILLRRFPYKLFYRLEGKRIIVFRVLHARRDHPPLLPHEN
jgi:toxin ParE1/3/4